MYIRLEDYKSKLIYQKREKDKLVPVGNAAYAKKMLVNAPTQVIRFPEENHFIPWTAPEELSQAILSLVDELND